MSSTSRATRLVAVLGALPVAVALTFGGSSAGADVAVKQGPKAPVSDVQGPFATDRSYAPLPEPAPGSEGAETAPLAGNGGKARTVVSGSVGNADGKEPRGQMRVPRHAVGPRRRPGLLQGTGRQQRLRVRRQQRHRPGQPRPQQRLRQGLLRRRDLCKPTAAPGPSRSGGRRVCGAAVEGPTGARRPARASGTAARRTTARPPRPPSAAATSRSCRARRSPRAGGADRRRRR